MSILIYTERQPDTVHIRWHGRNGTSVWRKAGNYNYGGEPHYPVPAIWYKHNILPHEREDMRFVSLANSNGWSDYFCWGDGLSFNGSRPVGICPGCGCDLMDVCQC